MTAQSLQSISGEGVTLFSAGEQKNGDASQPDRRRLQERRLPAPKSLVFASVMNVLADNGFRATFADATTGFITAIGRSKSRVTVNVGGLSRISDQPTVSVFLKDGLNNITSVRVVFGTSTQSSGTNGTLPERILEDETIYTHFFNQLALEIEERSAGNVADVERLRDSEMDRQDSQASPHSESLPSPSEEPVVTAACLPD